MEKKITSAKQFDVMVAEMEKKPHLAKQFQRGIVPTAKAEWEDVAEKMNAVGPPTRDVAGWQKVNFAYCFTFYI